MLFPSPTRPPSLHIHHRLGAHDRGALHHPPGHQIAFSTPSPLDLASAPRASHTEPSRSCVMPAIQPQRLEPPPRCPHPPHPVHRDRIGASSPPFRTRASLRHAPVVLSMILSQRLAAPLPPKGETPMHACTPSGANCTASLDPGQRRRAALQGRRHASHLPPDQRLLARPRPTASRPLSVPHE